MCATALFLHNEPSTETSTRIAMSATNEQTTQLLAPAGFERADSRNTDIEDDEDQSAWDAWLGDDLHGYPRDEVNVHPAQWCVEQLSKKQGREQSE